MADNVAPAALPSRRQADIEVSLWLMHGSQPNAAQTPAPFCAVHFEDSSPIGARARHFATQEREISLPCMPIVQG
jgi:hypothetical protein